MGMTPREVADALDAGEQFEVFTSDRGGHYWELCPTDIVADFPPSSLRIKPKKPDLLPCPFCGEPAEIDQFSESDRKDWQVLCVNDGCRGAAVLDIGRGTKEAAIATWNKRRPGDMTREQIDEVLSNMEAVLVSHSGKIDFDEVRRLLTEGREDG